MADALTLIIRAKLGGEDEPRGMASWLKHRAELLVEVLNFPRASMPHESTISRILGEAIEPDEIEQLMRHYVEGTILAGERQGLHVLCAYLPEEGVVLQQTAVTSKENEISAAPRLLTEITVRGKVVMGDALHTQRATSLSVVTNPGDYLWLAKDNQPGLSGDIAHLFAPQECPPATSPLPTDFQSATDYSYGHGRLEKRRLTSSSMLKDYLDWPDLEQVFKLETERLYLSTGQRSREIHYGLTSLSAAQATPARLLALKRRYWGIENRLHSRRAVSLKEDRCRLRRGQAARLMAILNNLMLALIDRLDFQTVPDARRCFSAKPLAALTLIFQNPAPTLL